MPTIVGILTLISIYILLSNVKMPTIVDILTFISIYILLSNVKMPTILARWISCWAEMIMKKMYNLKAKG